MSRFNPFRDWPARGDNSNNPIDQAAGTMTDAAQILDVVKREWSEAGSWSDFDQGVRDRITDWLRKHGGSPAYPAPRDKALVEEGAADLTGRLERAETALHRLRDLTPDQTAGMTVDDLRRRVLAIAESGLVEPGRG